MRDGPAFAAVAPVADLGQKGACLWKSRIVYLTFLQAYQFYFLIR